MRIVTPLLLLLGIALCSGAEMLSTAVLTGLSATPRHVTAGSARRSSTGSHRILLRNLSLQAVTISGIESGCGCTGAVTGKRRLAPLASAVLELRVDRATMPRTRGRFEAVRI